jgi:hypothetical protein
MNRSMWPGSARGPTPRRHRRSRDANRCIGYLTKYLTNYVADCQQARTPAQHKHSERLADTLRNEP